jgi:ABC-type multidrug transport system permease subunit
MYAIFMLLVIFANVCSQIMPHYDAQRALYQSRESPSKTYSWQVFVLSNLLVEIPWNSLSALLIFVSWYYPIGLRHNALEANEGPEREALMFLFILAFMNFAGTFTNMVLSVVGSAEAAGNLTNLLHSLSLIFCGYADQLEIYNYSLMLSQSSRVPRSYAWFLDIHVQVRSDVGHEHTCGNDVSG